MSNPEQPPAVLQSMTAKAFTAMTNEQKACSNVAVNNTLFDNPMVRAARAAMSPEQLEHYAELGRQLHSVDFENPNNLSPAMMEGMRYIEAGIKSGLLPADLEKNEIQLLHEAHGEEWWKHYGFTADDMVGVKNWKAGQ